MLIIYLVHIQILASWGVAQKDSGGAPQLKGARLFSFDELNTCTNNFAENNEIGSGGYGKVNNYTIYTETITYQHSFKGFCTDSNM